MISVRFGNDPEKGSLSMELRGHAGFAELGKDPVCAGASVLAMTVAQGVKLLEEAGKLRRKARLRIREGEVLVSACPREEAMGEARHLFRVGELGLRLLAEAYPENVEIRSAE